MNFVEQIMSKDKYPRIFLKSNGGYCVYNPSNIFRNTWDKTFSNSLLSKTFTVYEVKIFWRFLVPLYRPAGLFLLLAQIQTILPS